MKLLILPFLIYKLPALRTQQNIFYGWDIFPIYRNINNHNVIYALNPPEKTKKSPLINVIILAETFRDMLESGTVNNQSELAKYTGLSRARITQILNLLNLPEELIEKLREYSKPEEIKFLTERRLRPIIKLQSEEAQYTAFNDLINGLKTSRIPNSNL